MDPGRPSLNAQAIARLLVVNGFEDVRIVGGSGDRGADVMGVKAGELWVVQCKFVTNQYPSPDAVDEVVESSRFYQANRLGRGLASRSFRSRHILRCEEMGEPWRINVELLPAATLMEMARRSPDYQRPGSPCCGPYQVETVDLF